jgi:hypothetical protein
MPLHVRPPDLPVAARQHEGQVVVPEHAPAGDVARPRLSRHRVVRPLSLRRDRICAGKKSPLTSLEKHANFLSMSLRPIPSPEEVVQDLLEFFNICWQALEVGAASAVRFFESQGITTPDDKGLAAHLTRYNAKKVLDGFHEESEFERDDLPFSGLLVHVKRPDRQYLLRIRRSSDGALPRPQSCTMRDFYSQAWQPNLPYEAATDTDDEPTRLMLLWTTLEDYSQVTSLTLACPKSWKPGEDVEAHWYRAIRHPATTIMTQQSNNEASADDLPITDVADEDARNGAE